MSERGRHDHVIAVDIGATKTMIALFDAGVAVENVTSPTVGEDAGGLLDHLASGISMLITRHDVARYDLAIAVAGAVDAEGERVVLASNLPLTGVALKREMEDRLGVTPVIEEDANAAALGEARLGAARDALDVVYVTVSTGIGAGIVIGGAIHRGAHGIAGELGHLAIRQSSGLSCRCGRVGCLETYASGRAICERYRAATGLHRSAKEIMSANDLDDRHAVDIISSSASAVADALNIVAGLIDPEVLVIGGGLTHSDRYFGLVKDGYLRTGVGDGHGRVALRRSELGHLSVIAGAHDLVRPGETDGPALRRIGMNRSGS